MIIIRRGLSVARVVILTTLSMLAVASAAAWALSPIIAKFCPIFQADIDSPYSCEFSGLTVMPGLDFVETKGMLASFYWDSEWKPWDGHGWHEGQWVETESGYYASSDHMWRWNPKRFKLSWMEVGWFFSKVPLMRQTTGADGPIMHTGERADSYSLHVYLSFWVLSGIFGAYPAVVFIRSGPARRRRKRRRLGQCERCAYDLTGNTSGVCPECGTAVK